MASLQAFLQDRHTLNLLSIVIGIFAGLYGFYELLGRPGGILRQLLVAVPSGVLAGGSLLVADTLTQQFYTHTLQTLTQIALTPAVLALIGFFPSFLVPIGAPSAFRVNTSGKRHMPSWSETMVYLIIVSVAGTVSYAITLEAILAKINPFHWQLAAPAVAAFGFGFSLCGAIVGAWGMRQGGGGANDDGDMNAARITGCAVLALLNLSIFLLGVLGLVALIELFSWSILIYFAVSALGVVLIIGVQYLVDRMSRHQLGYLALILFGVAALIQLYLGLIS